MTLLSPGIEIKEKDLSLIIPTVSSAFGGIAGRFNKGPINTPILISSEDDLVNKFGKPDEINFTEWFTAAQFLAYTNKLWTVRAASSGILNATTSGTGVAVLNDNAYSSISSSALTTAGQFIARDPGTFGNNIGVIMIDEDTYSAFSTWSTTNAGIFPNNMPIHKNFASTPSSTAYQLNKTTDNVDRKDELYILILDVTGIITGTPYTILEKYEGLSKAADAVDYRGISLYYASVINDQSAYVYWAGAPTATTGANIIAFGSTSFDAAVTGKTFASLTTYMNIKMSGGVAGTTPALSDVQTAYDQLNNVDLYNVNLILTGAFNLGTNAGTVGKYVVENLVQTRKDAIAFISPYLLTTGLLTPIKDSDTAPEVEVLTFKSTLAIPENYASYAVFDSGFKYMYDRYNNKYRWVPLNGDVAGVCAHTDEVADPWWSPGGFNRGGVKNVVKLAFNPNQAQRDAIYPSGINPVVSFPGQGVILYGDRTGTTKPSAFDRINVRRLFLVLEKAISVSAKYQLFEFNDSFTRAQFKNMVEPYLRNIQGRRGITSFSVVCDESNNTGQVIDSNQFVADIYIKPQRSINFITLSFVATRSDVQFSQVVGA